MKRVKIFRCYELPDEIIEAVVESNLTQQSESIISHCVFSEGVLHDELKGGEDFIYIEKNRSKNPKNWCYFVRGKNKADDWFFEHGVKPYAEVMVEVD